MKLVIIDISPELRATLLGRVQTAIRQAGLRRIEVVDLSLTQLDGFSWTDVIGCLAGPGCFDYIEETVGRVKKRLPDRPIGIVLGAGLYDSEAVALRRQFRLPIMNETDLAQISSFVIDCESVVPGATVGLQNRGVVGFCQFKGGVGVSTAAAGFASCWARHGLSVVLVDLDDVNPQITEWARVGPAHRSAVGDLLREGTVPQDRINELVFPVEGYDGKLVVVGQPVSYNLGFHFKANVIEGAPSAADFLQSLVSGLAFEFDVVVLDLGRSWGIASFAALLLCHHIVLVTDDDALSVRRTLDGLARLKQDSNDPEEFNLSHWSVLLNAYTGQLISPRDVALEIQRMELFPTETNLFTLSFSPKGRQWGAPGQSFYDLAEEPSRAELRSIAFNFIPFRADLDRNAARGVGGSVLSGAQRVLQLFGRVPKT